MGCPNKYSIEVGCIYNCITSNTQMFEDFGGKHYRSVLVVSLLGQCAKVYACSSRFDGFSKHVKSGHGNVDLYIVFKKGLYCVPIRNLKLPGSKWEEWADWKKQNKKVIQDIERASSIKCNNCVI